MQRKFTRDLDHLNLNIMCGLELHIQLNTSKLFCSCPSIIHENPPDFFIKRKLRAVAGETGEIDIAAITEERKNMIYHYEGYSDSVCLVELDEEPPHRINSEALDVALQIAFMLKMKPVDEIHIMRKTVIDGSNVSGFQRTAVIAFNGEIQTSYGPVRITTLCLEEDAARRVDIHEENNREDNSIKCYRLDRLGIPLLELRTDPDIRHPAQALEAAELIGLYSRIAGKARRGIGTIRQDVNVSIEGGERVEIKGVQDLRKIPEIVKLEAIRQQNLLGILNELQNRKVKMIQAEDMQDFTSVLQRVKTGLIRKLLSSNGKQAIVLPLRGFHGLLSREISPGTRLGTELADYARVHGGVQGIVHSDEDLDKYGISNSLKTSIFSRLGLDSEEDSFLIIIAPKKACIQGIESISWRLNKLFTGIPPEVRGPRSNGTTYFQRPLPGGARMYPETDHPPVNLTKEKLDFIKNNLPESPKEKQGRFVKEYKMSSELALQIVYSRKLLLFDDLVKRFPRQATFIASFLLSLETEISKTDPNIIIEDLDVRILKEIFKKVEQGEIPQSAVIKVLIHMMKTNCDVTTSISELGIVQLDQNEIEEVIRSVVENRHTFIKKRGLGAIGPLMGVLMGQLRGKAEGSLVSNLLKKEIEKILED